MWWWECKSCPIELCPSCEQADRDEGHSEIRVCEECGHEFCSSCTGGCRWHADGTPYDGTLCDDCEVPPTDEEMAELAVMNRDALNDIMHDMEQSEEGEEDDKHGEENGGDESDEGEESEEGDESENDQEEAWAQNDVPAGEAEWASADVVNCRNADTLRFHGGGDVAEASSTDGGAGQQVSGGGDAAEEGEGGVCCRNCDTLARLHPLPHEDASSLHFAEEDHRYTCWGRVVQRSVTAVISSCFDAFDADAITQKCLPRWAADETSKYYGVIQRVTAVGGTAADAAAQIRGEWMERGTQASRLGTEMHRLIEHHLNRTPLQWPAELAAERRQFHAWEQSDVVREYQLQPLRTELTVAWVAGDMVVTAGQIDSIWIDRHGRLYMIDWKRSRKPLLAHASASYGRFGSGPLAHVPDSAYFRYALQQNMYALLFEQRHGLQCDGGLYLLRLHAELGEGAYEMVQCPDMRTEAMALLELEHARLLAESTAAVDAGVSASRSPRPRAAVAALVLDSETADWLEQEPAARREARRARGDLTEQCKGHHPCGLCRPC